MQVLTKRLCRLQYKVEAQHKRMALPMATVTTTDIQSLSNYLEGKDVHGFNPALCSHFGSNIAIPLSELIEDLQKIWQVD